MPTIEHHELEAMPTLHAGHFANLKIDTTQHGGMMRVWVSRCTLADGEPEAVSVEVMAGGVWTMLGLEDGHQRDVMLDAGPWSGFTVRLYRRMDRRWNRLVR